MPDALRLLPLVPVDGLPAEPDTGRPYKVNVISTTPGVKPLTVGVVGESPQNLPLLLLLPIPPKQEPRNVQCAARAVISGAVQYISQLQR